MKIKASNADRFAEHPPLTIRAVLIYGPDSGLVRERMNKLARSVVEDLSDPFRVTDLTDGDLRQDPARLSDEAAAIAMLGGRRVVRVRAASDGSSPVFQDFLNDSKGDTLILVESGDLGPRSSLRKLFEETENAAALPCYTDDAPALEAVIRERLTRDHLSAETAAVDFLIANLGSDRGVTQNELEKLALYVGPGVTGEKSLVTLADARACIGDNASTSLDDLVDAAAGGNLPALDIEFARARAADTGVISIVNAVTRHMQQLHLVMGQIEAGSDLQTATRGMRPPIHFSRQSAIQEQLRLWSRKRLDRALALLLETERQCKTTGLPDLAICGQALLRLALAAQSAKSR